MLKPKKWIALCKSSVEDLLFISFIHSFAHWFIHFNGNTTGFCQHINTWSDYNLCMICTVKEWKGWSYLFVSFTCRASLRLTSRDFVTLWSTDIGTGIKKEKDNHVRVTYISDKWRDPFKSIWRDDLSQVIKPDLYQMLIWLKFSIQCY